MLVRLSTLARTGWGLGSPGEWHRLGEEILRRLEAAPDTLVVDSN